MADTSDTSKWYKVKELKDGKRVIVFSLTRLNVLVRTVLQRADFSHSDVQQSDYVYEWEKLSGTSSKPDLETVGLKQRLKKMPLVYPLLSPMKVSQGPLEVSGGSVHITLPPVEATPLFDPGPPSASTSPGNP